MKELFIFLIGSCFGWVAWRSFYLGAIETVENRRVSYMNDRVLFMLQRGYRPQLDESKLDFKWINDGGSEPKMTDDKLKELRDCRSYTAHQRR